MEDGPCGCEDVHALEAFRAVHLREHLVHHTIRDPRAVVSSGGMQSQ